jgi:hypothetical protein
MLKLYHKANRTQIPMYWHNIKSLRNNIVSLIHTAKRKHKTKLADSLTSDNASQNYLLRVIKSFISLTEKQIISALTCPDPNKLIFDNKAKPDTLNKFFCIQSSLDSSNKETAEDYNVQIVRTLTGITVTPQDVEDQYSQYQ